MMRKLESKFNLGDRVKGTLNGAEGTVIAVAFTISGRVEYNIMPLGTYNGAPGRTFAAEEFFLVKLEKDRGGSNDTH